MSSLFEKIAESTKVIKSHSALSPVLGIVLGSGLGAFADRISNATVIPYGELPNFPKSSVAGHKGELIIGHIKSVPVAVMSGRTHAYEGYALREVTFPVRVLAALGIKKLLLTNAAGSVNPYYKPGDFMAIVDHLNLTGANPLVGSNDERLGPRFPDMSRAYSMTGRKALHDAASAIGVHLHEGIYAGMSGPSYETPAEIRMLQTLGADAVGMSTVAEAIVAAHSGLELAALSIITNRASGLGSGEPLSHEEVKEIGQRVGDVLCQLLEESIGLWS